MNKILFLHEGLCLQCKRVVELLEFLKQGVTIQKFIKWHFHVQVQNDPKQTSASIWANVKKKKFKKRNDK